MQGMITYLRELQLNLMLILSGICIMQAVFVYVTKILSKSRKKALIILELSCAMLLVFDRYAYIYRGNTSELGYYMVRISNFFVYFFTIAVIYGFNMYMKDLYVYEADMKKLPGRFKLCDICSVIGVILIFVSQFTDLYYTFDSTNHYQRTGGFFISFIIPLFILAIDLSIIIQYSKGLRIRLRWSLFLFALVPFLISLLQVFAYGFSLVNITIAVFSILLYILAFIDLNDTADKANRMELDLLREEQKHTKLLFEQTAQALASAIDAKDKYTHGHSTRVAEYSEKIARAAGWDDEMCEEVYYSALLHDVGKIGIPDHIINKEGKLTDEEFGVIKTHPTIGNQILSSIVRSPYLSIGAHFHHERYDGHGYPDHLKGEDIPAIARIIAVADAYDAMTSKRSYRDPIPQDKVREEFVKGIDSQFDPEFAKIMLHLIDLDTEYEMKEKEEIKELGGRNSVEYEEYRSEISEGILVNPRITKIYMRSKIRDGHEDAVYIPSIVLFDSLDGRVYYDDYKKKDLLYYEYAEIRFDGKYVCRGARKIEATVEKHRDFSEKDWIRAHKEGVFYDIEGVRKKDHALIRIKSHLQTLEFIIALPDSARFAYIGLTGEYCEIDRVEIIKEKEEIPDGYIRRIAEEVTYIDGPEGDIPNVQIDGWRSMASEGIEISDDMDVTFHSMSLPTARLVWHCPYISIYYSDDGKINGPGFREFVLIRPDGENWESDDKAKIRIMVNMDNDFGGWDEWKQKNKEGLEYTFSLKREGNKIKVSTVNLGLQVVSVTEIMDDTVNKLYLSLTGDQVALTDIRIHRK